MPLNNEVDTLNIHNLDNDIRDSAARAMIAAEEKESYATNDYAKNQYLIWNDRKLYKATTDITHGDTLTIGGNIRYVGTLSDEVYKLHISSDEGIRELVANIEEANASKAYYFGDYIVLASDGLLYQVTTNVSLGTLWAVGTNIKLVDNVAAVLTELKQGVHKTQQMLATVEPTNKASKSYNVGDQFIFNDELVEATAHIEQQATITKGINCKDAETVTSQINDVGSMIGGIKSGVIDNTTRKLLVISDSYGQFLTPATNNFPYKLINYLGCTGDVIAEPGGGFIGNGTASTFKELFDAAAVSDYTDIVFAGGYNDRTGYYGDIRDAAKLAIQSVNSSYSHVNIWLVCMAASADSDVKHTLLNTLRGYYEACIYPNTHFVDLSSVLLKRELLAMDGVHPGANGAEQLAMGLAQAMKRGFYDNNQTLITTAITDRNGTRKPGFVTSAMDSGMPIMKIASFDTSLSTEITSFTCDGLTSHEIKLCDLENPLLQGGVFNTINANLYVKGKQTSSSNSVFWNIPGYYYIFDSELRFVPMRLSEGYSSWFSLYSVEWIKTPPLTFLLPSYAQ